MTAADWGMLVPVIVTLLGAVAAYLKAQIAQNNSRQAVSHAIQAKGQAALATLNANLARKDLKDHLESHQPTVGETDITDPHTD